MSRATITAHPNRPGCWVYRVPDLDRERAVPFAEGVVGDLATAYQRAAEALRRRALRHARDLVEVVKRSDEQDPWLVCLVCHDRVAAVESGDPFALLDGMVRDHFRRCPLVSRHVWQRGSWTGTVTCARCGLLPVHAEDERDECPGDMT